MHERCDIAVVGAGAAGLFAGIWAGRTLREQGASDSVVALDGATKLGAKILVAGGGRCNVTHHRVDPGEYAGSSVNAIRKVLLQFDVPRTVEFFRELGVELKREETGKLFPVSDDARTVLDALLRALRESGASLVHPWRVKDVRRASETEGGGFVIQRDTSPAWMKERHSASGIGHAHAEDTSPRMPNAESRMSPNIVARVHSMSSLHARRVIVATGGKSLPKTGSDGAGYEMLRGLGHTITPAVFPALVPLTLPKDHWTCQLSGVTVPASCELRSGTGKRLRSFENSLLLTHFGLSGPAILDLSRYYTQHHDAMGDPGAHVVINWLPGRSLDEVDARLLTLAQSQGRGSVVRWLQEVGLPERLARGICEAAGIDAGAPLHTLTREKRRALASMLAQSPMPVTGDRGYLFAEVTAGGVPLSEVRLETMESRVCPGLHLCGEVCDVDGRIGGFNFQWAWASGFVAGVGAARGVVG